MLRIYSSAAVLAVLAMVNFTSAAIIPGGNPPIPGDTAVTVNGSPMNIQYAAPTWSNGTDPTDPGYWTAPSMQSAYDVGGGNITKVSEQYNSDPIVGDGYTITNTTNAPMAVSTSNTVTLPTPFYGPTTYQGSIGISLTDLNGDGASITDNGGLSIYQASIDGSPVLELFNQTTLPGPFNVPQPFNFSFAGPYDTEPDNTAAGPFSGGPSVISTMTIRLDFVLSPFDSVAITSNFRVAPEPASLALLGLGAIGLLKRRR